MRAHERQDDERVPRPPLRPVGGAGGLLGLQRAAGNGAVSRLLSAQRARTGGPDGAPAEVLEPARPDSGPSREELAHLTRRERELTRKHGIRIGPKPGDDRHFGAALLDRIDRALSRLPSDDVRNNASLEAIEFDPDPSGSATLYDDEARAVHFVVPVGPLGARLPQWLYALLNTDSGWQRGLMDEGALADYEGLELGGAGTPKVMGKQGNLVEWTVRHEVGHAVEHANGWVIAHSGKPGFGGWRVHGDAELDEVAAALLRGAALRDVLGEDDLTNFRNLVLCLRPQVARQNLASGMTAEVLDGFAGPGGEERRDAALAFLREALSQPWTREDGGRANRVEDRTYHLDHDGTWVSYLTDERRNRVSNYQFSNPDEWFAEVYAAFYGKKGAAFEAEGKLTPVAVDLLRTRADT